VTTRESSLTKLNFLYYEVTNLWKSFCELHNLLLEKTFDEYSLLLSSDVDALEPKIEEKKQLIAEIATAEKRRQELIKEVRPLALEVFGLDVIGVSDLLEVMRNIPQEVELRHLERFNLLLIDIIGKIQQQNKRTQVFINKAIHSLQTIREDALGTSRFKTYNSRGAAHTAPPTR
jgi:flagellar biosynthesis/type III secretory pathway chaperone